MHFEPKVEIVLHGAEGASELRLEYKDIIKEWFR